MQPCSRHLFRGIVASASTPAIHVVGLGLVEPLHALRKGFCFEPIEQNSPRQMAFGILVRTADIEYDSGAVSLYTLLKICRGQYRYPFTGITRRDTESHSGHCCNHLVFHI